MSKNSYTKHPYHIVEPSPWPFALSISIFILFVGFILYMQKIFVYIFYLGLALMSFSIIGWIWDIIQESKTAVHNSIVRRGFKYSIMAIIASEVMLFIAFFCSFFNAALMPPAEIGSVWPPRGITTLNAWDLPYFNTLLLLLSGTTATYAHQAIKLGKIKTMMSFTLFTIISGSIFLIVQAYEYIHAPFVLGGGIYPSIFYIITGFHGLHVLIGLIMLIVCWFRAKANHFTYNDHFSFDATVWYWHFVDIVWIFLFFVIYCWGS